jgi:hypothetical protein
MSRTQWHSVTADTVSLLHLAVLLGYRHTGQQNNLCAKSLGGTAEAFSRLQRPWREADHSFQSSTQVKNEWSRTPIPLHTFVVCTF